MLSLGKLKQLNIFFAVLTVFFFLGFIRFIFLDVFEDFEFNPFPFFVISLIINLVLTIIIDKQSQSSPESRINEILETMNDGILFMDPNFIIKYANAGATHITGYAKQELEKNPITKLFTNEVQLEKLKEKIKSPISGHSPVESEEHDLTNKSNALVPVGVSVTKMLSKNSELLGYIFVVTNIKSIREKEVLYEQKAQEIEKQNETLENTKAAMLNLLEDARALEEELKKQKETVELQVQERTKELVQEQARLKASINSLNLGFIMTDTNAEVVTMNGSAKIIFSNLNKAINKVDIKTEDLNQKLAATWQMKDIQDNLGNAFDLKNHILSCLGDKKSIDLKDIMIAGKFLHVFLAPIIMVEDNSNVIGVVILLEDITEAKLVERSKDEFFSIASHELRTPLTSIRGNTSMIKDFYADQIKDKELKEMIDDIHDSSLRLIGIVNDFLNTSRLEQGRMVFDSEAFSLVELIQNVIKEFDNLAKEKTLTLNFSLPNDPIPEVFADKDKVKQILINLLGNALKFTEKGEIGISLVPSNGILIVKVTDTGRGISEQNQNILFRKFQQASDSLLTRDTTKGTGLGLYISKLMIEGMGGSIWLENSNPGKGSTFVFTIPLHDPKKHVKKQVTVNIETGKMETIQSEDKIPLHKPVEGLK